MKFVAPEIEVKKFDVADILTTSGEAGSSETTLGEMESSAVFGIEDCGPCADT